MLKSSNIHHTLKKERRFYPLIKRLSRKLTEIKRKIHINLIVEEKNTLTKHKI